MSSPVKSNETALREMLSKLSREDSVKILRRTFGDRGVRAAQKAFSKGVKKLRFKPSNLEIWLVRGRGRKEHVVLPGVFCDCKDFYLNVVVRRKIAACHHLLAQILAERFSTYEEEEERDFKLLKILSEEEVLR